MFGYGYCTQKEVNVFSLGITLWYGVPQIGFVSFSLQIQSMNSTTLNQYFVKQLLKMFLRFFIRGKSRFLWILSIIGDHTLPFFFIPMSMLRHLGGVVLCQLHNSPTKAHFSCKHVQYPLQQYQGILYYLCQLWPCPVLFCFTIERIDRGAERWRISWLVLLTKYVWAMTRQSLALYPTFALILAEHTISRSTISKDVYWCKRCLWDTGNVDIRYGI